MPGALEVIELDAATPIPVASVSLNKQQQVLHYVHNQLGIPQQPKPGTSIPTLPNDITALDDNQLGYQLSTFAQWVGYIDYQLANADGERTQAESYLTFVQARIRLAIKAKKDGDKKLTTKDKDDIMETHPDVIAAREKCLFWESTWRLTKSIRDACQMAWETISRRITQRGQEVDRMRRETNVSGIPSGRTFTRTG